MKKLCKNVIIISGTPGVGKSTLVRLLSKKLNVPVLNIKAIVEKIKEKYDTKKKCYVVDVEKLNKEVVKKIKESDSGLIIASHLIHHLSPKYVDLCIVVKCADLKVLRRRLVGRKYGRKKIEENLECEIFEVCLLEAKEKGHKVVVVDSSQGIGKVGLVKGVGKKVKLK